MTLIYAHRGARREAAENTQGAFDKALAYPIDGMETDIQLSRDDVAVLWHDDDLKKLGMPGRRIDDLTLAELRALDFAAHFAGATHAAEVIRLRDFVAAYHARCALLLEIKRYPGEPALRQQDKVQQTLAVAQAGGDASILVSSFDLESLLLAHRLAPGFPLILNLEPEHDAGFARRMLADHAWLRGLCVHIATLDQRMLDTVRAQGKLLAVYTCNSDEQIGRALRLGVDILISDLPHKALQMRDA